MVHINSETFNFLADLKNNNDRDWFNAHKDRYLTAKENFEDFINALIAEISKFDHSIQHHTAKDCVFRIYRDIRFSKDKSPYKTHFGAHITAAVKKSEIHSRAGYYINLSPGDSMLAGGAYRPNSKWLANIRATIDEDAASLKEILNQKDFRNYFGEIEGEQLKKTPKGYDIDHPEIDLLRYKSFLVKHECEDKKVLSKSFLNHATKVFNVLFPFDQFLNRHTG